MRYNFHITNAMVKLANDVTANSELTLATFNSSNGPVLQDLPQSELKCVLAIGIAHSSEP